jgi:hypothetical protein
MSVALDYVRRQRLAFDMIPSAWSSLSKALRGDVMDLIADGDFMIAMDTMLEYSTTVDPDLAELARAELAQDEYAA